MARLIMPSIVVTVFPLTRTACPLTVWTLERPLRVCSEVRKTSARGGGGGEVDFEGDALATDG